MCPALRTFLCKTNFMKPILKNLILCMVVTTGMGSGQAQGREAAGPHQGADAASQSQGAQTAGLPRGMDAAPPTRLLRHVVLFQFNPGTPQDTITTIREAFEALPESIPGIQGFEWGLNNSPEGLNKGFTHCFLLTFHSEADRDAYLPHPKHKAFGDLLGPHLADVLVVDYWTGGE